MLFFQSRPVLLNSTLTFFLFVRLKLKHSEEVLVVPVEVEVSDQGGLYPNVPVLDFGMGGSAHAPHKLQLQLANSLKRALRVMAVGLTTPNKAVTVDFEPVKVPPGSEPVTVATLTYNCEFTQKTENHLLGMKQQQDMKTILFALSLIIRPKIGGKEQFPDPVEVPARVPLPGNTQVMPG